ncbi:MAG TPA: hypothetical protein VKL19_17215 [Thermoanaerobaculia bacterium]|nr:hypothetical protein [Thermoanaerobaculia bacterium]
MLRKLNFTERVKLPRSHVRIALRRQADGYLSFEPTFSFEGIDAPAEARVYVEAYHRTSFMRFDCGSVGQLVMPADRRLTDIDGSSIRFRIKVVDETDNAHRIVAVADDIRVAESAPEAGRRVPLLPVQFTDALEQQAWRIAFEPDSPVLELNNRIIGVENIAKDDALFFSLVYPAAVREILTEILLIDGHDAFEESTEWWALWIRWALQYANAPLPTDSEDAPAWIDDVVSTFCSQHRVVDRLNAARGEVA